MAGTGVSLINFSVFYFLWVAQNYCPTKLSIVNGKFIGVETDAQILLKHSNSKL